GRAGRDGRERRCGREGDRVGPHPRLARMGAAHRREGPRLVAAPAEAGRRDRLPAGRRTALGRDAALHRRARVPARLRVPRPGHAGAGSQPPQRQLPRRRGARLRSVPTDGAGRDRRAAGGSVKYYVRVLGKTFEVGLDGRTVTVDGQAFEAHLALIPGTALPHLLLAGHSCALAAQPLDGVGEEGGQRWVLGAVGQRFDVEAVDERTRQIRALTGGRPATSGGGLVVAPRPWLVVRVEGEAGPRGGGGGGPGVGG